MKALTALVPVVLMIGCAGNMRSARPSGPDRMKEMETRMDLLERKNRALQEENVKLRQQPQAEPDGVGTPTPQPSAGRAWTRQAHGQYVCIVDYDAHVSLADRVRFENKVDETYGIRKSRNNSWVSFTLNGQPVAIVRSTVAGPSVQYHLGPEETCWVELGGATHYKVVGTLYKNKGTLQAPVLVSTDRKMRWEWDMGPDDDELPFVFQKHHF